MVQINTAVPAVSVLVPVYNMQRYLPHCMKALCEGVLENIEIIAINDGSTDASRDILGDFARDDARIRIIDKPNSGYGASMNRGLDQARGDYIGIVEPDDYSDLVMFKKLYKQAVKHDCDMVKCNYYEHYEGHENIQRVYAGFDYGKPFDPATRPDIICTIPSIWAGIYRRSLLEREGVRFRETPGASFQDTAFTLKTWIVAQRVELIRRPLLHYRMDNPGSSVKSLDKVVAVCDEIADAEDFLRARPDRMRAFMPWFQVGKWGKYRWNYERIDAALRPEFAQRMYDEFTGVYERGELAFEHFGPHSSVQVARMITEGPQQFVAWYGDALPGDWEEPVADEAGHAMVRRLMEKE